MLVGVMTPKRYGCHFNLGGQHIYLSGGTMRLQIIRVIRDKTANWRPAMQKEFVMHHYLCGRLLPSEVEVLFAMLKLGGA